MKHLNRNVKTAREIFNIKTSNFYQCFRNILRILMMKLTFMQPIFTPIWTGQVTYCRMSDVFLFWHICKTREVLEDNTLVNVCLSKFLNKNIYFSRLGHGPYINSFLWCIHCKSKNNDVKLRRNFTFLFGIT